MSTDATVRMDRMYRYQRHIYDLTRKYYLLGRDDLIERLRAGPGARVVEIGCGTGRNLVLAAQRHPEARFFGIDVSTTMLDTARETIARAGLADRVTVAHADATDFDPVALFGVSAFERVFFSYSLSMIPDWTTALEQALAIVAPGGELQIVDFGGQERLPPAVRWLLRSWLSLFDVSPRDRLEGCLGALALSRPAAVTMERQYRGYAQYATVRVAA